MEYAPEIREVRTSPALPAAGENFSDVTERAAPGAY